LDLNKDQRIELSEWTKANGGKKKGGGKQKGDSSRGSLKAVDSNKRFKSMISEMEGRQNKMFEAMAEVKQSSIAAIQASASPEVTKMKPMVSTVLGSQGNATKEVLFERANMAMLKLNGILKSNDGKKG
jgi:adenylosuccinate synthase